MRDAEIKEFRKRHNLTQEDVSKIVGVGVGAVRSWEQGVRNISKSAVLVLKKFDQENKTAIVLNEPSETYGPDYKELYFDAKYTIEVQKELIESFKSQLFLIKELNTKSKAG